MKVSTRFALPALSLAACAAALSGCGLHRHVASRPDYDLPQGYSGTYRFNLVLAGEVPAGPTDREALARLQRGSASASARPFAAPLSIEPGGGVPGNRPAGPPPAPVPDAFERDAFDPIAPRREDIAEPVLPPGSVLPDAPVPAEDDPALLEGPLA